MRTNLKFYGTGAGKSSFRMINDTVSANFQYTANKKYRSFHVRNVFPGGSELRLALALKYAFPHLIWNVLFCPTYTES